MDELWICIVCLLAICIILFVRVAGLERDLDKLTQKEQS